MKRITLEEFNELISISQVKPRLKRELRFITSTEGLSDEEWNDRELLSVCDRSGSNGVLIISIVSGLYIIPYELDPVTTSFATGRSQSIICDFCRTWQYGDRSASIRFQKDKHASISYLCCADLKCSMHVRSKTEAAHISRSQLREDLSVDQRVERLKTNLAGVISTLSITPVQS
jgi:hypothetical protein